MEQNSARPVKLSSVEQEGQLRTPEKLQPPGRRRSGSGGDPAGRISFLQLNLEVFCVVCLKYAEIVVLVAVKNECDSKSLMLFRSKAWDLSS